MNLFNRFKKEVMIFPEAEVEILKATLTDEDKKKFLTEIDSLERPFPGLRAVLNGDYAVDGGFFLRQAGRLTIAYKIEEKRVVIIKIFKPSDFGKMLQKLVERNLTVNR